MQEYGIDDKDMLGLIKSSHNAANVCFCDFHLQGKFPDGQVMEKDEATCAGLVSRVLSRVQTASCCPDNPCDRHRVERRW